MTKRYNANKNRWYALLLCNVPYPLPFEDEEAERDKKARQAMERIYAAMSAIGYGPYFPYFIR